MMCLPSISMVTGQLPSSLAQQTPWWYRQLVPAWMCHQTFRCRPASRGHRDLSAIEDETPSPVGSLPLTAVEISRVT